MEISVNTFHGFCPIKSGSNITDAIRSFFCKNFFRVVDSNDIVAFQIDDKTSKNFVTLFVTINNMNTHKPLIYRFREVNYVVHNLTLVPTRCFDMVIISTYGE